MTDLQFTATIIILVQFALYALIINVLFNILYEIKKGNKDQQEIKTRLHWMREREIKILKK